MLTDEQRIKQLLESPEWTAEDRDWLLAYLDKASNDGLRQQLTALYEQDLREQASVDETISQQMRQRIADRTGVDMRGKGRTRKLSGYIWWAAAAAVVGVVLVLVPGQPQPWHQRQEPVAMHDAQAGSNKATLTLADGSVIRLDSAGKGAVLAQGNTNIIQTDTGLLSYRSGKPDQALSYNTISTPRGGQYQVVLSDGTRVWLNAASSLRFPAAFAGQHRIVELTGEAYFEVARRPQPFSVRVIPVIAGADTMQIAVLGTHFNVNAYANEATQTATLLEGAIRVEKGGAMHVLRPGQQAIVEKQAASIKIDPDADLDEAVAWKNGQFIFNNLPLETVMRQIERWYDVDVAYEGDVKHIVFNGQLSRYANVSRLLDLLQTTGEVHFTIENKKIIVRP